jgi:1-acyl-sn-glycerol-3-phosphate acyltransferase
MFKICPKPLLGCFALVIYCLNTIVCTIPIIFVALLKLIFPFSGWRRICDGMLNWMASSWISVNNLNQRVLNNIHWDVRGIDDLSLDKWYLVLANHQSWVDILVLQNVFNRKIPFLKFFLKKELIWVPVLGLAWWALDFPFMKRYSRAFLKKYPHLKGRDLEITRRACEKFKTVPVAIMNFVEGTRFTSKKHEHQQSPYVNLLKPKSGGVAFVLGAMGQRLHRILDVTIVYPQGAKSFWAFLCGEVHEIRVVVKSIPVTEQLLGDYFQNPDFQEAFRAWLNRLWSEKDRQITTLER